MLDAHQIAETVRFAVEEHGDQPRRGSESPYASHLLQVAGLVLEYGGDENQAIAGLLHDTLEDCDGVEYETFVERFVPTSPTSSAIAPTQSRGRRARTSDRGGSERSLT